MRRGFTLIETMMVLALVGILGAIAFPRVHGMLEVIAVDSAAGQLAAAHARARMQAILTSRVTLLDFQPDSLLIRTITGSDTTVSWTAPGPGTDGITLTGPSHSLVYSPVGLTLGASNGTWHLAYGAASRDVIVSRLGRLRVR